jgi:hypothetical protein
MCRVCLYFKNARTLLRTTKLENVSYELAIQNVHANLKAAQTVRKFVFVCAYLRNCFSKISA